MTRPATDMERRVAAVLATRAGLVPNDGAIERHLGDARAAIKEMRLPVERIIQDAINGVSGIVVWSDWFTLIGMERP